MKRPLAKAWQGLTSKKGQALVEYALILALVAMVILASLTTLKEEVGNTIGEVSNTVGNVM